MKVAALICILVGGGIVVASLRVTPVAVTSEEQETLQSELRSLREQVATSPSPELTQQIEAGSKRIAVLRSESEARTASQAWWRAVYRWSGIGVVVLGAVLLALGFRDS